MAATVLKLVADTQALPDQPQPTAYARPVAAASALIEDLRDAASASLQQLLAKMFRGTDDVLNEMSERAADAEERRLYIETMQLLHLESSVIARRFTHEVMAQFSPLSHQTRPEASVGEPHAEQLEEQVTVINLASRIKHLHAAPLADLQQRFGHAARNAGLPLSPQALSAKAICTAFAQSLRQLDMERKTRMILYRVFDRLAVAALGLMYAEVLAVLARYGMGPAPAPGNTTRADSINALPMVSAETIRCLQRAAGMVSTADSTEALLARELLAIVRGKIVAGGPAAMQRIVIAGNWLDAALERLLHDEAGRRRLEALRYVAIRCALTDSSFLSDAAHPLRVQLQTSSSGVDVPPVKMTGSGESVLAALRTMESLQAPEIAACLRHSAA